MNVPKIETLVEMVIPIRPLTADWRVAKTKKYKKKRRKQEIDKAVAYENYKNTIREYAAKNTPIPFPLTETIEVEFTIYVTGNRYGDVGDHDNYSKPLGDALQGILWVDDNQIKRGTTEVVQVHHRDEQRIEVRVWPYYPGGRFANALWALFCEGRQRSGCCRSCTGGYIDYPGEARAEKK